MSKPAVPSTMRAHLFTSTSPTLEANLKLVKDAPLPENALSLGPDQALIQVTAASLNPVDYKLASIPLIGKLVVPRPSSPGLDFAGRITAAGSSSTYRVGAPVFGRLAKPQKYGTLGEYIVAEKEEFCSLPPGLSAEDAAGIGTAGLTAYLSIVPYVTRGSNVFINGGSGGTGTFGIQVAKALGCHVTTTCSNANVELCKELGADEVIDYRSTNVAQALKRSNRTIQHVVDNIGTDPTLWSEIEKWTDPKTEYVQIGADANFSAMTDILKKMFLPTWLGGPNRKFALATAKPNSENMTELAQWVLEGKIKVIKDTVLPYQDAREGFVRLRTGRTKGKIIIEGAR